MTTEQMQEEALDYRAFRELATRKRRRSGRSSKWRDLVAGLQDGRPVRVEVDFSGVCTPDEVRTVVHNTTGKIRGAGKALTKQTGHARYSFVQVVDVSPHGNGTLPHVWACIPLHSDVPKWEGRWSDTVGRKDEPSPRPAPSQRA